MIYHAYITMHHNSNTTIVSINLYSEVEGKVLDYNSNTTIVSINPYIY